MDLLKKLSLAIFISVTMFATAPAALAAGKIQNATAEEVSQAIDDTISYSEEALTAVQNGGEKDAVLALLKSTKQSSKRIESNIVDRLRSQANSRLAKARTAIKKDDTAKAEALLAETVELFKAVKNKYHSF